MTLQKLELRPNRPDGNAYCPVTGTCICGEDYIDLSPATILAWCHETDDLLYVPSDADGDKLADAWHAFMQEEDDDQCLVHCASESDIELFLARDDVQKLLPGSCLLLTIWMHAGGCVSHEIPEICLINLDYEGEDNQ